MKRFSLLIESLTNKASKHLSAEFAHKMLLLELELENDQVDQIHVQELLQHYRNGVEFYSKQQSQNYKYFLNKMNLLLTSDKVSQVLKDNQYQPQLATQPSEQTKIELVYDQQLKQRKSLIELPNNIKNDFIKQSFIENKLNQKSTKLVTEQFQCRKSLQLEKQQEIVSNREAIISRIRNRQDRCRNNSVRSQRLNTCPDDYIDSECFEMFNNKIKNTVIVSQKHKNQQDDDDKIDEELQSIQSDNNNNHITISPKFSKYKESKIMKYKTQFKFQNYDDLNTKQNSEFNISISRSEMKSQNSIKSNYNQALEDLDKQFGNKQNSKLYQKLKNRLSTLYEVSSNSLAQGAIKEVSDCTFVQGTVNDFSDSTFVKEQQN